ncbi:hypothetical protein H5410_031217 [Solanum commersonii]|uniref:Uncharacterized protein n=1 Tax=Solanum commersonii TaxID=4109 RepID=A0A9J5YJ97_SOLCO|nr:hypothetical protein H5410_031217 [Solanum commersonii]
MIIDSYQQITMTFSNDNKLLLITAVYARCNTLERLELWEQLEELTQGNLLPWVIGGDFNVILNEEEKLGGLDFTQHEAIDFASCISNCALSELKTTGSKFTWWNGRIEEACIFKRLNRVLVN